MIVQIEYWIDHEGEDGIHYDGEHADGVNKTNHDNED